MTYCQVKELPAVYYVCYTENMYLDIDSLMEFTKLTSTTPFKDFYEVSYLPTSITTIIIVTTITIISLSFSFFLLVFLLFIVLFVSHSRQSENIRQVFRSCVLT